MSRLIIRSCAAFPAALVSLVLLMVVASGVAAPSTAKADSAGDWLSKAFPSKLGGPVTADRGSQRRKRGPKGVQVASLGEAFIPKPSFGPSLSGGGNVRWVANSGCLNSTLRGAIADVAANYGSVTVSSTCRSHSHNARVGGAPKSHHLTGDAADFRVHGNYGAAHAYLKSNGALGGVKHYGGGLFHIDTGPKRSW